MSEWPFRTVEAHVLHGPRGTARTLMHCDAISYPFMPDPEKERWRGRLEAFARNAERDFSLLRVTRAEAPEEYELQALGLLDPRADHLPWRDHIAAHADHLSTREEWRPELFLTVDLAPPTTAAAVETVRRRLRRRPPDDDSGRRASARAAHGDEDARVRARVADSLPARAATTAEFQWLLRRNECRGLGEPETDAYWRPDYDLLRLGAAPVTNGFRHLKVESHEGVSYQAILCMGALPENPPFPGSPVEPGKGAELLFAPLDALPFPVDAVVHARWIGNAAAVRIAEKRLLDAEVAEEAHPRPRGSLKSNVELAEELLAHVQAADAPPLLAVSVHFAVGAGSLDILHERVAALRARYGTVKLWQPAGLQRDLYDDMLPRPDGGQVRRYEDVLTVRQFSELMPIGANFAGSDVGVHTAHVMNGGRRSVRVDVTAAPRHHRPPSISFSGSQGSGKTVAAQLIAFAACMRGSQLIDIDPKPDHRLHELAAIRAQGIDVIELSADAQYRGLLDPLRIAPPNLREDRAVATYMELFGASDLKTATVLREATAAVLAVADPCSLRVIDALRGMADDHAKDVARALEVRASGGLAMLALGDGTAPDLGVGARHVTFRTPSLVLPAADVARRDYDEMERLGVALLKLLAVYAMRLIEQDATRHKIVPFDEAWVLYEARDGRQLADRLNRTGRTRNATFLPISQLADDQAAVADLVGQQFVFAAETDAEARRMLASIALDAEDGELRARVRANRAGRCFYRDLDGRVVDCQVEAVIPGLLEALDTAPRAATAERVAA